MRLAWRYLATAVAWLAATALLAPICFLVVVVLAGPHSDLLPNALQPPVLALGWLAVLVGPVLVARAAWRRTGPPQ